MKRKCGFIVHVNLNKYCLNILFVVFWTISFTLKNKNQFEIRLGGGFRNNLCHIAASSERLFQI